MIMSFRSFHNLILSCCFLLKQYNKLYFAANIATIAHELWVCLMFPLENRVKYDYRWISDLKRILINDINKYSPICGTMFFPAILLVLSNCSYVSADYWSIPVASDYLSRNNKFIFHDNPIFFDISNGELHYGACSGSMYRRVGNKNELLWRRMLLNNVAPIQVVVSDSGKCVITLGEWHKPMFLPVIFYGQHGELINVYGNIKQILPERALRFENKKVVPNPRMSWLKNSIYFFGPNDDHFIIRLNTGEILLFETETGELIDKEWKDVFDFWKKRQEAGLFNGTESMKKYDAIKDKLNQLVIFEALRLASSEDRDNESIGNYVLNDFKDKETIDILFEAIKDSTSRIVKRPDGEYREYPIRKIAKKRLDVLGEKVVDNVVVEERYGGRKSGESGGESGDTN
jgi:hypothetical protein